jgi:tRNA-Thr(GGU) m(6)t(6)A37 methyltransferase TsaA
MTPTIPLNAIGRLASELRSMSSAPKQGNEGAPDAWLKLAPEYADGLMGIQIGDPLTILTWLHQARRDVLHVHPRQDASQPMKGVFATRSPHRPNPIGIHCVQVLAITQDGIKVGPIEAIDGTPVLDIKISLRSDD